MKRLRNLVVALPLVLPLMTLAACSSTATEAGRAHLPFHVAVLPIEIDAKTGAPQAESAREIEASDVLDVNLELDEAVVSSAFVVPPGASCALSRENTRSDADPQYGSASRAIGAAAYFD